MSKLPETLSWSFTKIRILTKRKSSILTSRVLQTRRISALCSLPWKTRFSSSTWGSSTWFESCCALLTHSRRQDLQAPHIFASACDVTEPVMQATGPGVGPYEIFECGTLFQSLDSQIVFIFLFLSFGSKILCKFWIWYFIEFLKATVIYVFLSVFNRH